MLRLTTSASGQNGGFTKSDGLLQTGQVQMSQAALATAQAYPVAQQVPALAQAAANIMQQPQYAQQQYAQVRFFPGISGPARQGIPCC